MASPKTVITITHGNEAYATISRKFNKNPSIPEMEAMAIRNFFHDAIGRDRACSMIVGTNSGDEVLASATLTVASGAAADTGVVSGTTFTCVDHRDLSNITYGADSSGSLNSTYFKFQDQSGAHKYYLWFSINSLGVDPAPAGRIGIKVSGATGATAATLATASVTATAANAYVKATFAADSSGSLNSTYFTVVDNAGRNKIYFWFNINKAGVDPAPAGYTGIQVVGATNATAATLATAAFNAAVAANIQAFQFVNPSSGVLEVYEADGIAPIIKDGPSVATSTQFVFVQPPQGVIIAAGSSGHITITNSVPGVATTAADGPATSTGFTFTHSTTGSAITSVQYQLGTSDTLTAANLAAAINAKSALFQIATASSAAGVVTVKSFYPGPIGNYITLTASGNVSASAATLGSGALATTSSTFNTYHLGV